MEIADFASALKIPTHPIWYYKGDETPSKKHPIGEKNNIKMEDFESIKEKAIKKMIVRPKNTWKRVGNEFVVDHTLSQTEYASLQKTNSLFVKYTPNLYCVDVDEYDITNMTDFITKTGFTEFSECCWCVGNTKGIHIYITILDMPQYTNQIDVFDKFNGDLIGRQNNVWEKWSKQIINFNGELISFQYEAIKYIFNAKMLLDLENTSLILKSGTNSPSKQVKRKSPVSITEIAIEEDEDFNIANLIKKDKFIDLLFNVIKNELDSDGKRIINRVKWIKICSILICNNYDMRVFLQFCKPISNENNETSANLWKAFKIKHSTECIYGLQNIAKEVNNFGYKAWLQKYDLCLKLEILDKGENDVAAFISPYLKGILIFSNEHWILNDKRTNLWRIVKEPMATIITIIQRKIDESISIIADQIDRLLGDSENDIKNRDILKNKQKLYEKHYASIARGAYSNQITKLLKEYLYEVDFDSKLDSSTYIVAYQNGILNLKTLKFRDGIQSTDYLTKVLPYNYEKGTESDKKFVKNELMKILNMNPKHYDYYLSYLGYSMTGDASKEQIFLSVRGQKASNGKSVLFNALYTILPIYIKNLEQVFFNKDNKERHKTIAEMSGIRLAFLNEMNNKKIDREFIKDICDGKSMPYKVMYGTTASMPINFKIAIIGNTTLNVDADAGVKRRIKIAQMDSEFSEDFTEDNYEKCLFKCDKDFELSLSTKYKFAFMDIIYEYSQKYSEKGALCEYPEDWKKETNEAMSESDEFQVFFETHFETGDIASHCVSKVTFDIRLETFKTKMSVNQLKDKFKSLKINFTYDKEKRLDGAKGVWYGIREIVVIDTI